MNNKVRKKSSKNKSIKSSNHPINITKKINYKFYTNCPIIDADINNNNNQPKEKYYWFAAYDKLIKAKKLLKIFSFYNIASKNSVSLGCNNLYDDFIMNIKADMFNLANTHEVYVEVNGEKTVKKGWDLDGFILLPDNCDGKICNIYHQYFDNELFM